MNLGDQNFTFTMSDGLYLISNKISGIFPLEKINGSLKSFRSMKAKS